jgi:hypothetical protein
MSPNKVFGSDSQKFRLTVEKSLHIVCDANLIPTACFRSFLFCGKDLNLLQFVLGTCLYSLE